MPGPPLPPANTVKAAKVFAILATLLCVAGFGSLFGSGFDLVGVPYSFRYRLLVKLAFVTGGSIAFLAIFTVAMKWVLAGSSAY